MSEIITAAAGQVAIFDAETQERVRQSLDAGTADNTRRAYQGDLRYFWAWARLALGLPVTLGRKDVTRVDIHPSDTYTVNRQTMLQNVAFEDGSTTIHPQLKFN